MFKKLKNRLLFTNMIIIILFVIVCLGGIWISTYVSVRNDISRRLDRAIEMCRNDIMRPDPFNGREGRPRELPGDRPEDMERKRNDTFMMEISVYCDKSGNIISKRSMFDEEPDYSDKLKEIAASGKSDGSITLDVDSWAYKRVEFENGYIIALTKNESEKRIVLTTGLLLCAAGILSIGISFLISLIIANRAIKPVEESYNKQKQFVTDASHELRTPLASISANTDVLLSKRDSTIDAEIKWLEYIKDETDRMTQLTNDLLSLAKADAALDEEKQPLQKVSFSEICDDALLETEAFAFENNINLSYDIAENIEIMASSAALKQVVLILIDNALKYTPSGGSVYVRLDEADGKAVFYVENDGSINNEDIPHLFERFYRADKSRARESGGYGLGLAIAKSLCDGFGGSIKAQSQDNRTRFTVTAEIKNYIANTKKT
ncbi:MAG: HAMP domain-containing histidine kinase [Oscillospiraceae bacterium]|nr:HAMP domain-containing histidine kinase [Oscillospiraceae bacterium]